MKHFTILSTKKLQPALKTALEEKGVQCIEQEFIIIRPITTPQKQEEVNKWIQYPASCAIVFTSRHAAETVNEFLKADLTRGIQERWKIFSLEGSTREALLKHHHPEQIIATAPNAESLAKAIIDNGQHHEVVFFCGNKRRNELPDMLQTNGIKVNEVIVYETTEAPQTISQQPDAILFFSPSAVTSFFSVNTVSQQTACFAIGPTTAQMIAQYTHNRIITSERPDQETILASCWQYLQNTEQHK